MGLTVFKRNYEAYLKHLSEQEEAERTQPSGEIIPWPGGQARFWELLNNPPESVRWVYGRGGTGSGKSSLGVAWFCDRRRIEPLAPSLVTANSYPQLSRSTLVALAKHCQQFGIPLTPAGDSPQETGRIIANRQYCYIWGAFVFVVSMENFGDESETGRGLEAVDVFADELAYATQDQFETLDTRLGRGYVGKLGKGLGVACSSPNKRNPYNFAFSLFDDPDRSEELKSRYISVVLSAEENQSLPPNHCVDLKARYPEELYTIEVLGEYAATTTGKVYKLFNRADNCLSLSSGITYNRRENIYLGFDFNWSPSVALAGILLGTELVIVKEWWLPESDTFQSAAAVFGWLREQDHQGRIFIYGDASGDSKTANSKKTNWAIVWDELRNSGLGSKSARCYGKSNPDILDSVLMVNSLFKQQKVWVLQDNCPRLVRDLEQVSWKSKSDRPEIDKRKNPELTHISDAFRYMVWGLHKTLSREVNPSDLLFSSVTGRKLVGIPH